MRKGKRVNINKFYYYCRSQCYYAKQRAKRVKQIHELGSAIAKSKSSPLKTVGQKSDVQFNSFICHKSSEIRKLLPKSPHKSVAVLKHMWDQCYRSPQMRHYMNKYWDVSNKEMYKYMLQVGKHKACKDICKIEKLVRDIKCNPDPDVHSQEIDKKPQDNKKEDEPMTTQVIEKQEDVEIHKIEVQKDSASVKNPDKSYKEVVKHVEENIDVVNEQEDNSSGLDTKDAHLKAKDISNNQVDGISDNLIIDLGEDKSTICKDVDSDKDKKKVTFDTLDNTVTNMDEPNLCISSVLQTLDTVIDEVLDDLEADSNRSDTVSDVGNSYDDLPLSQMPRRNPYIGNSSENTDESDDISRGNTEEESPDEIW